MVTQLTENSIAVDVPVDANSFQIYENNVIGGWCIMFLRGVPDYDCCYTPNLPKGSWQILGRGNELTEEQWKAIILRIDGDLAWIPSYNDPDSGGHGFCYDDYESEDEHTVYYTATESGLSLLKSKNVSIYDVIILVKAK